MGLVDYSSSDNDSDTPNDEQTQPPPAKKPRTSTIIDNSTSTTATTNLPPLPSSFHNLYATTVRPFTADLPSLHQGRKRLIPHIQGNWPSHIYVEWHPSPIHHEALSSLLYALQTDLQPFLLNLDPPGVGQNHHELTTFLTSDLGAPLPLHISLSRPFVLRTEQKDAFRETLSRRIASTAVAPFELRGCGLAWFRSAEASRSFLVLRVRSALQESQARRRRSNPQLAALLEACNEAVAAQGQPRLYAAQDGGGGQVKDEEEVDQDVEGGGVQPVGGDGEEEGEGVDAAFHVSVAWSFAEPTEEIRARTAAVFASEIKRQKSVLEGIKIPVDSIKLKIGNAVTDIPLAHKGTKGSSGRGLFGI